MCQGLEAVPTHTLHTIPEKDPESWDISPDALHVVVGYDGHLQVHIRMASPLCSLIYSSSPHLPFASSHVLLSYYHKNSSHTFHEHVNNSILLAIRNSLTPLQNNICPKHKINPCQSTH